MKPFILTCLTVVMIVRVFSQWSTDPSQNTLISGAANDQALPRIATLANGNYYICWFSIENGNYNVRLQYLDQAGNTLWDPAGMLISDNPSMTWLTDYCLSADPQGYALIAFQDIRSGFNDIYAYRIGPDGTFAWGDDGITLSSNPDFEASPQIAATAEGNAIIAWTRAPDNSESYTVVQKISPSGQIMWGTDLVIQASGSDVVFPYLYPSGGDNMLIFWHKNTGVPWSPGQTLYCRNIDGDGNPVWASEKEIYTAPAAPIIAYLRLEPDNNNGVFCSWYEVVGMSGFTSYAHYIGFDGNLLFPSKVELSSNTATLHMYPVIAYLDQTQELLAFWSEQDGNQTYRGIMGQKLNLAGDKLWGDYGLEFEPMGNMDPSIMMAGSDGENAIVAFYYYEFGNFADAAIKAMLINNQGQFVWPDQKKHLCSVQSEKIHPEISEFSNDQWVVAWEDDRNNNYDIYAQNIHPDGSLGPGANSPLTVNPDTLFFITVDHALFGMDLVLENPSGDDVIIQDIDTLGIWFYMDPLPVTLPCTLPAGQSLNLLVYVNLPVGNDQEYDWIFDSAMISADGDQKKAIFAINEDILSRVGEPALGNNVLTVYPNPCRSDVMITVKGFTGIHPEAEVLDILGQSVTKLEMRFKEAGTWNSIWNREDPSGKIVPEGLYFIRVNDGKEFLTSKLMLVK